MLQTLHGSSALLFPSYFLGQERNKSYLQRKKSPLIQKSNLLPPGIALDRGGGGGGEIIIYIQIVLWFSHESFNSFLQVVHSMCNIQSYPDEIPESSAGFLIASFKTVPC